MPHFGARPARHSVCAVRALEALAAGRSTRALGVMDTSVPGLSNSASLYSPVQTFIATLLGGPAAGGWTLSANFRATSRRRSSVIALVGGVIFSFLLAVVALKFSSRLARHADPRIVHLGYSTVVLAIAHGYFGTLARSHVASSGAKKSWWRVAGIALLGLALMFVALGTINAVAPGGDRG